MKEESQHYFNLAIKRLENIRGTNQKANQKNPEAVSVEQQRALEFVIELLKEQVPHEDSRPTTR